MRTTYLYIKQHKKTGLKYFGKTVAKDPYRYKGSGRYWRDHINKHSDDITTLWVKEFNNLERLQRYSILFSKLNKIVESKEWANLIHENGLGGKEVRGIVPWNKGLTGIYSAEHRQKLSESRKKTGSTTLGMEMPKSADNARRGAAKLAAKATGRKRKYLPNGKWTWEYPKL